MKKKYNLEFCQDLAKSRNGECLSSEYKNNKNPINWKCDRDHRWLSNLNNILNGSWCPVCAHKIPHTLEFCKKVAERMGGKCFSTEYVTNAIPMLWECVEKHQWSATFNSIYNARQWCGKCKNNNLFKGQEQFLVEARIKHGTAYDYSGFIYKNAHVSSAIICTKCETRFFQTPHSHLRGGRCPKCVHVISFSEVRWLDSIRVPKEYRHKTIAIEGKKLSVDAFDPESGTVYEFYGDYWHGNPKIYHPNKLNSRVKKTFGELYRKTMDREILIKSAGYNLISIWEDDFKKTESLKLKRSLKLYL